MRKKEKRKIFYIRIKLNASFFYKNAMMNLNVYFNK